MHETLTHQVSLGNGRRRLLFHRLPPGGGPGADLPTHDLAVRQSDRHLHDQRAGGDGIDAARGIVRGSRATDNLGAGITTTDGRVWDSVASGNGSDGILGSGTANVIQGNIVQANLGVGVHITSGIATLIGNTVSGNLVGLDAGLEGAGLSQNVIKGNGTNLYGSIRQLPPGSNFFGR